MITTSAVERRNPEGDGEHTDKRLTTKTNKDSLRNITNPK